MQNAHSQFFVKKCKDFFQTAEPIIRGILLSSALPMDTILDDAKEFFEKIQTTIAQALPTERFFLDECKEFLLDAARMIDLIQPQIPIKEFQELCENAYPSLLNQYRRWMEFIEKSTIAGFQKVNLLKVFGISGKEEAHSRFLVWLMKEEESHELGNIFLEKFLASIAERYEGMENLSSEGASVIPEASGEHGVPDIKILGKDFLCVLENKIRAMEGKDQTERYANDALKEIERIKIRKEKLFLIFLTPTGRAPLDKRFKTMNYREVIKLLREILQCQQNMSDPTRFLIEQFIFNLQMEILHDFDLEKKIELSLREFTRGRERYLWGKQEDISSIYDELIRKEGS